MTDLLRLLPPFEWRGAQYPLTARRVFFRHEGVEHTIQYRDFAAIEQIGAQGLTFAYTIPTREDIATGPYKQLFVTGLPRLFRDALNREADDMLDPVLGFFRCVPVMFEDITDINKRDGDDVSLEFRFSPEQTDEPLDIQTNLEGAISGLETDAGALDQEVARANWEQEPSPEPTVDIFQAVNGVLSQGLAQIDKVTAKFDDFAQKMEAIEQTTERLSNPQLWPMRATARRMRELALRTQPRKRRLAR